MKNSLLLLALLGYASAFAMAVDLDAPKSKIPDPNCGISPHDWCAAPAGDPCGKHANEAACRADPHCRGMQYRGESVVACMADGKGFWSNCPAVGCVSRPDSK